jgi:hypothetical protein
MEQIQPLMDLVICNLQQVIKYVEENKLIHEQEFLNFLDDINELSVSY